MNNRKTFIPILLLAAFALSLVVAVPAASDTGALRFFYWHHSDEDQQWARQGGLVGLEVVDADLDGIVKRVNVPGESVAGCDDCALAEEITLSGEKSFFLSSVPVADSGVSTHPTDGSADGFVNRRDVSVVDDDGNPIPGAVVDRAGVDGRVDLEDPYTGVLYVRYWGAKIDDTADLVRLKSRADPNGIVVKLVETRPGSGVFRHVVGISSHRSRSTASPPNLRVGKNDVITLAYEDADPERTVQKTMKVETSPPVFSGISPPRDSSGRGRPEVEFDVTDLDSGIHDGGDIEVIFGIDVNADGVVDVEEEYYASAWGSVSAKEDGFNVRQRLPNSSAAGDDATIYWWALAWDSAGNLGVLDSRPSVNGNGDPCYPDEFPRGELVGVDVTIWTRIGRCQPHEYRIDNTGPRVKRSVTGRWWDASKSGEDKTEYNPTKARNDSILVQFDEDLDVSTVQPDDFEVDGAAPLQARVFDGRGDYVFLTVPEFSSGATPKIKVVGEIRDRAGNRYRPEDDDPDATPTPTPTPAPVGGSLELLIAALKEARKLDVLPDGLDVILSDWFIVNLLAPGADETPDRVRERLPSTSDSLNFLIIVLHEMRARHVFPNAIADTISDWLISDLIAPATGETPADARDRLSYH